MDDLPVEALLDGRVNVLSAGDSIYVQSAGGFDGGKIAGDTITILRSEFPYVFVKE